jgi:hypothetical protein
MNIRNRSKGGILVEFAIAIPVLISVLFLILDYTQFSFCDNNTKDACYYAASMIQGMKKNEADKKITSRDLQMVAYSAFLNYYTNEGSSLPISANHYARGHQGMLVIFYVKRTGSKYKVIWNGYFSSNIGGSTSNSSISQPLTHHGVSADISYASLMKNANFNINQEYTNPSEIYPDLNMEDGETKIILQMSFHTNSNYYVGSTDAYSVTNHSKKLFNFFLLPIKVETGNTLFFRNTIVFSPNRYLFDDTPPA